MINVYLYMVRMLLIRGSQNQGHTSHGGLQTVSDGGQTDRMKVKYYSSILEVT